MDSRGHANVAQLAEQGKTQFSQWDASLFRDYCELGLLHLRRGTDLDQPVHEDFCLLVYEAVGRGYVTSRLHQPAANLMEHCLREWLPRSLAERPVDQHAQLLASSWNVVEGLLQEPRWVNAYVLARAAELTASTDLREFLTRMLKPLFEPIPRAAWTGPFQVTALSLRGGHDDFLPGEMHLIAPNILAVKDRRRDLALGLILRKQGQSELVGAVSDTRPYEDAASSPEPRWQGEWLKVGKDRIQLKFLREPFRWVALSSGYVVASALDSQKLWIVESAA